MRKFFALMAVVLLVCSAATAFARVDEPQRQQATQALTKGQLDNDLPAGSSVPTLRDTIDFGFYENRVDGKYAIIGEKWTFDHGAADPLEGWIVTDLTENIRDYWRHMTQAIWVASGNPLPWPQMNASVGIALVGANQNHADSLGWSAGIGYGNDWCQRLTSPTLIYDGTGAVDLQFNYFNETEAEYDYSKVYVNAGSVSTLLNSPGFDGLIGIDTLGVITQATYTRQIQNAEMGGGTAQRNFTIVFEFKSDGGLSDEDGREGWDAFYGAWGVDNVTVQNNVVSALSSNFDSGLGGWTASRCPGIGSYMGIAPLSNYVIQDPCECSLSGNILEFHNSTLEHPVGQHIMAETPIVDRMTDIGANYLDYNQIMADWDQYSEMPQENGVFYRAGWSYYPYENPNIPGLIQWSPRIGIGTYYYVGLDPLCTLNRNIGTAWGLPPVAQRVKWIYELFGDCDAFGVDPCSDITNFTPVIDNIVVRNVGVPNAPSITFETGAQFQDGFGQNPVGILATTDPGNANITYNKRMGTSSAPALLGDSLVVAGPVPGSTTKWESKMWFRLKRMGPAQTSNSTFTTWRNAIASSPGKPTNFWTGAEPNFTWGYMDSIEVGTQVAKNKFCSQFRDGPSSGGQNLPADADFSWGPDTGEQDEGNEILPDLAFTPGTKIDYFITANYICLPTTYYYLPDTTGKFYSELEILPSFRMDGGTEKFPCLLYVDGFNRGSQTYIEDALNQLMNGLPYGSPIPDPTTWDRYDYFDASSNWKGAMYRDFGGNNGATIPQLMGYRAIIFNTGTFDTGCTWARDWQGMEQWLTGVVCEGNTFSQAFIGDGTNLSKVINTLYPRFLTAVLGAVHRCDAYFEQNCPPGESENDEQVCVRVEPVPGSPFGAGIPTDVYGNWCPLKVPYSVMGTTGSGQGNKNFVKVGPGTIAQYAQVINDRLAAPEKYRTVIEDFAYHLVTERDLDVAPDPALECPADTQRIVNASFSEIQNALKWSLNIANPQSLGLCTFRACGTDVPEETGGGGLVNRLYQNEPNPFNPRTTIRFSLAQAGPAELVIYDVNGRKVKTLVSGNQVAGQYQVVWDGTNDAGMAVASGVFWSQLKTEGFSTNKKMVILK